MPYYRVNTKKQKRSGLGLESKKAIVEHFAGIAQRARELISIRTKAALKAKKKRRAKLSKVKVLDHQKVIVKKAGFLKIVIHN